MRADFPSPEAIAAAAVALSCDVAAIRAVATVEAGPSGAFLQDLPGEPPVILFERHTFHRLSGGRFANCHAEGLPPSCSLLSSPEPGGYGPVRLQHQRLAAARTLDDGAAVMSASWGLFQVMGENFRRAGCRSLAEFEAAMRRSVDDHLQLFASFIHADGRLQLALQRYDWTTFARIYNGPAFAEHGYHTRLAEAFRQEVAA